MDSNKFFGVDLIDEPLRIRELVESILSPDMPDSLESILSSLPPRPRYIGPEAWLDAFAHSVESNESAAGKHSQESEPRAKRR